MSHDDQPDLDAALADAVRRAYVRPVDEITAQRHVSAIVAAAGTSPPPAARRPRARRRVWRPALAGVAATLLLPVGLATAGVALPSAVERPYRAVGIALPHQPRHAPPPAAAPAVRPATPATTATIAQPRSPADRPTLAEQADKAREAGRKATKAPGAQGPKAGRRVPTPRLDSAGKPRTPASRPQTAPKSKATPPNGGPTSKPSKPGKPQRVRPRKDAPARLHATPDSAPGNPSGAVPAPGGGSRKKPRSAPLD